MTIFYPQVFILIFIVFWLYKTSKKRSVFLYLSLIFFIAALSRPVVLNTKNKETLQAKDLIIALDVSYSMKATDIKPSRLELAKTFIYQILSSNKNNRFSLFAFTKNALILSPPTTDYQLLLAAIGSLEVDNILTHGTNLENLIDRISKMKIPQKDILLFSDGGDHIDLDYLVKKCKKSDIRIFAVGLGTKKGSLLTDSYGKKIKDKSGNLVVTRLNSDFKALATQTGGDFINYKEIDLTLEFIDQNKFSQKNKKGYTEYFYLPLLLGLFLFWFSFVEIPRKVLLLFSFLPLSSDAGFLDWYYINKANMHYEVKNYKEAIQYFSKIEHKTMQSQMNLANSYYQSKSYQKAKDLYEDLESTNPKIKHLLLYKLGNCTVRLKDYKSAKIYYQNALIFGKNRDIIYNLKVISFMQRKNRKDFASFHSGDKERANTPQGSKKKKAKKKKDEKNSQKLDKKKIEQSHKRPLGYKAYELINKGYIDEKKPW